MNAAEDIDLIFANGNIYTVSERQPHAEAIAVKKDRVAFVGSNADVKKLAREETRVVDLGGKTVVPGLTDSHCHIFGIGEREMRLNLEGTNTLEDFLAKVKERVAQSEHGKWITGRGWDWISSDSSSDQTENLAHRQKRLVAEAVSRSAIWEIQPPLEKSSSRCR